MKKAIKAWLDANVKFDTNKFFSGEFITYDIDAAALMIEQCMGDMRLKMEAEIIEDIAQKVCPVSGYVIRSEQGREDLIDWAQTLRAVASVQD